MQGLVGAFSAIVTVMVVVICGDPEMVSTFSA